MTSTPSAEPFDTIVIGSGQAGPSVAVHLANKGQTVALVERDKLGGTCLNVGCRPTKALRASARAAYVAQNSTAHGVTIRGFEFDIRQAMARMTAMIDGWRDQYEAILAGTDGVEIVRGHARFSGTSQGQHQVAVGERVLASSHVVINVGTRARIPEIPGLDEIDVLTNESILALQSVPPHLVVLGGSYIGLEFAQIFRRFGSRVTVIEASARVAANEDPDVSQEIERFLAAEGIDIHTNARLEKIRKTESGLEATLTDGAPITASHLLLAVGRVPNTDQLSLDTIGLTTDPRGLVATNGTFQTSVAGVVALGDINGRGAFTHTAYQDGEIYIGHLEGRTRTADGRIQTYALFTDPPLGRVGLNESQARALGRRVLVASIPVAQLTKGVLDGETHGLIKVLVDADSEQFLGATCLGLFGDEVVQIVGALMHAGARYRVLQDALPIHPTVAEFFATILKRLTPLQ